jgi:uncharacterized protein (DUF2236 family)
MISQRVNAERIVLLGWSRAVLMQLAHPLVAAGVAEHSTFREGPLKAAARLHDTVRAMLALSFGDEPAQAETIARIRAIHRRVNGRLTSAVGLFEAGTPYSAEDPALLLWVHATLLESIPLAYGQLVAPLDEADRDAYCVEAAPVAIALGARPAEVPRTWMDLNRYLDEIYRSGVLAIGPPARDLMDAVLAPRGTAFAGLARPILWTNRLVTVGLLPEQVRHLYGFAWGAADTKRFDAAMRTLRRVRRVMPSPVAHWRGFRSLGKK